MKKLLLTLLAVGGIAGAATVVTSDTFGSAGSPILSSNFPVTVTINKFDSTQGTLTAVDIALETTSAITLTLANVSGGDLPYSSVTAKSLVTVTGPSAVSTTATPIIGPFSGTVTVAEGSDVFGPSNDTETSSVSVPGANLGDYISTGPSDLDLDLTTSATTNFAGSATDLFVQVSASSYGNVTVTYTYTADVPEPASFALLGLSGLVFFRRRRR